MENLLVPELLGFNVFFEIELIACRGIINKEMLLSLLKIPKLIGI